MDRILKQIQQFVIFDKLLMKSSPKDYRPWYFPVKKEGKDPDPLVIKRFAKWETSSTQRMSWKADHARLTKYLAIKLIREGFNIGIAARKDDPLIIIDIDNEKYLSEMPTNSLITRSRRRSGLHGFFWKGDDKVKQNIPTDYGEMRCSDQYVLCAGSYVPLTNKDIDIAVENKELKQKTAENIKKDSNRGFYTVEIKQPPREIKYEELPKLFRKKVEENEKQEMFVKEFKEKSKNFIFNSKKKHSGLYDLKMSDIVTTKPNTRSPHPLHPSDTGQNFSISNDGTLCHCWRHCVTLNPIQFLCVKSGFAKCEDAGTPHDKGISKIIGDYGAIFYAWIEAKKMNLLPKHDKIPVKALWYIAIKHNLWNKDYVLEEIPPKILNKAIKIIEDKY